MSVGCVMIQPVNKCVHEIKKRLTADDVEEGSTAAEDYRHPASAVCLAERVAVGLEKGRKRRINH